MDKRKRFISLLAGLMALIMLLGLIAGFIPTAHAAKSDELKAQLDAMKAEKAEIDAKIKEIKGQITENNDEMNEIKLWDMKEDIGYVDECDVKIVQMVCEG